MQWNMTWLWAWRLAPSLWNSVWVTFVFMRLKGAVTKTWQGEDLLCQLFPQHCCQRPEEKLLFADCSPWMVLRVICGLQVTTWATGRSLGLKLLIFLCLFLKVSGLTLPAMKVYMAVGYICMHFHLLLGFFWSKIQLVCTATKATGCCATKGNVCRACRGAGCALGDAFGRFVGIAPCWEADKGSGIQPLIFLFHTNISENTFQSQKIHL